MLWGSFRIFLSFFGPMMSLWAQVLESYGFDLGKSSLGLQLRKSNFSNFAIYVTSAMYNKIWYQHSNTFAYLMKMLLSK